MSLHEKVEKKNASHGPVISQKKKDRGNILKPVLRRQSPNIQNTVQFADNHNYIYQD